MDQPWAVILAAGEGKRMQSRLPKVLHPLCGKPMLSYVIESAADLTSNICIVVGHSASLIEEAIGSSWQYVKQVEQLGTGHAVLQSLPLLPDNGTIFVLCGDAPLLTGAHLRRLNSLREKASAVVATAIMPDPCGYGRIIRSGKGSVERIVEEKDASAEERKIKEINTGTYCFDLALLKKYLPGLGSENAQKEYYLTDVIAMLAGDGYRVEGVILDDFRFGLGINNRAQLAEASNLLRDRINREHMAAGVTLEDPAATYLEVGVRIGADTVIRPGSCLEGNTIVGCGCVIGPHAHICNSSVGNNVVVSHCYLEDTQVEDGMHLEPFTVIKK